MAHTTSSKKKPIRKIIPAQKPVQLRATLKSDDFYGYDFVLMVDYRTGRCKQLGGAVQAPAGLYQKNPLHVQALQQAAKHGIYHYEWSLPRGQKHVWYQTTCLALPRPGGQVEGIVSLSRDISQSGLAYTAPGLLKDGAAPRTFAQILLATRETEKKEISKALHDEIGSSAVMLTALLSLVRASVQAKNCKQALRDLKQLDEQLKASIERIKNVVVSLRPPSLENKGGLGGAVRDLLENISALSRIPYQFDYKEIEEQRCLSDNIKILLYRIVQEALTNIVKHARAKHIRVSLKQTGQHIRLDVCDDGIGFEPAKQQSLEHVGLLAMKDGVKLLGGKIAVKSAPGKGTRITVTCPCIIYGGK
ncbi:MAG: sensor histidine kinase [Elusimicrobiaceae bacterium]|nr:sensor histidine kinase [Elusimicrobiaceae bacterium]